MKAHCLVVMIMLGGLMARAQTNTPGQTPQPPSQSWITAKSGDFDLAGHEATYLGHVRVDDPQMKLTCEKLIADIPQAGGQPTNIVAGTNVVIDFTDEKGQTNHATSDKAVYHYSEQGGVTNKTVTLTGSPQIENAQGTQAGDVIILDLANHKMHFDNPHMISRQNLIGVAQDTNAPPAKTNLPPGTVETTNINPH